MKISNGVTVSFLVLLAGGSRAGAAPDRADSYLKAAVNMVRISRITRNE